MRSKFSRAILAATLGIATVGTSSAATARPVATGRTDALRAALDARLTETDARLAAARTAGHLSPARARVLARRLARIRQDSARLERQQGFLSAAESASYNRMLDEIGRKLNG